MGEVQTWQMMPENGDGPFTVCEFDHYNDLKEDYDALKAECDQLLKDIESGFMAGAYARLQSLQTKERQYDEVVAERDKLAERLKLKEVFLDPRKERVCYGFVLKTVTDRERIIYTEMPWTDYAMEVLGDRVLERITMVDKQRLDKAIEDLTRHKEMLKSADDKLKGIALENIDANMQIIDLKSKLEKAVEALRKYGKRVVYVGETDQNESVAFDALKEIAGEENENSKAHTP